MATSRRRTKHLRSCPTGCRSCSRSPDLRYKSRQSARQEDAKKNSKRGENRGRYRAARRRRCPDWWLRALRDVRGPGRVRHGRRWRRRDFCRRGEIGGGRFGCGNAIARQVLAKIADRQFHFARTVLEEVFQFGSTVHARNARERECRRVRKRRCALLRGDPRARQKRKPHPK